MENIVIVRGGGDIASGTIQKLHNSGFNVLVLEVEKPTFIRRTVSYGQCIYENKFILENIESVFVKTLDEVKKAFENRKIPVIVDPNMEILNKIKPVALVDAILAKKNLGMKKSFAPFTVALGPGFIAGQDVDVVIETMRGHNLGRLIYKGEAFPNTGTPGEIGGKCVERVVYSPEAGTLKIIKDIGSIVKKDEVIAEIILENNKKVGAKAHIDGLVRGMLTEGLVVPKNFKIADVDPRISEKENCFTISDKARCIAGGVLEAIMKGVKNK